VLEDVLFTRPAHTHIRITEAEVERRLAPLRAA
jgi:hypothetical protein